MVVGKRVLMPDRRGRIGVDRIAVLGSPGSGKSTLSRQLGAVTGLPVFHLDKLYWKPGWVEPEREQWVRLQEDLVEQGRWIIDGHYGATVHMRIQSADTIIFLDHSRWVCLVRALKRAVRYRGQTRSDMGPGCPEKLDGEFLQYIWQFNRQQRPPLLPQLAAVRGEKTVVVLKTPRQVTQYLADLRDRMQVASGEP